MLEALSMDPAIPLPFEGVVIAAYPSSLTVAVSQLTRDIVSVVTPDAGDGPHRIVVPLPVPWVDDGEVLPLVGSPVRCSRTRLDIPGSPVAFRLGSASPWRPYPAEPSPTACAPDPSWLLPEVLAGSAAGFRKDPAKGNGLLASTGPRSDQRPPFSPDPAESAVCTRIAELAAQHAFDRGGAMPLVVRRLLGSGPGLTPAGDDFLVGFAFGLEYLGGREAEPRLRALRHALAAGIPDTGFVSGRFLSHCLAGRHPQHLLDLAAALASGDAARIARSAATVLATGSTSGRFTLMGIAASRGVMPCLS